MVDVVSGVMVDPAAVTEAVQKINAINLKTLTRLADLQFDIASLCLATTAEQAKVLTAVESYQELYSIEARLASDYGSRLMQISQATTGLLLECRNEYVAAMEGVFATAREKVNARPVEVKATANKAPARKAAKRKTVKKH